MNKKKNSKIVPFGLVSIFVLIGLVGWYRFQRMQGTTQVPIAQNTSESANIYPKPVVSPISQWTTYRNERAGFSLKYPTDYFQFVDSDPRNVGDSFSASTVNDQPGIGNQLEPNEVWLYVSVAEGIGVSLNEFTDPARLPYVDYSRMALTVDGMQGYKTFFTIPEHPLDTPQASYVYQWVTIQDSMVIDVRMSSFDKDVLLKNEAIFDQIISTMEFNL